MDVPNFEDLYNNELDARPRKVLHLFLQGHGEKEIATILLVDRSVINRTLSRLCDLFVEKIPKGEWALLTQGDKRAINQSRKEQLIQLFLEKKPELVGSNVLINKGDREVEDDYIYLEPEQLDSCQKKLLQVGMLLRIKAPKQWGKTFLVNRLLEAVEKEGYQTAYIDVLDADTESCESLDRFLQWFCRNVGRELGVAKEKLRELWDEDDDSKVNCNEYFDKGILPEVEKGLVLAFDNIDRLFQCKVAEDVLTMLRAWFEKSKRNKDWWKLRLIVAHATECYVPMNANQSPFNVGETISLSEFDFSQVKELVEGHRVNLNDGEIGRLMEVIGGHPFLVEKAIAFLKDNPGVGLDELLGKAATLEGIYSSHLLGLWGYIQEREKLVTAMKEIVNGTEGADLKNPPLAHQLESLGAVKLDGNKVMPRCDLYRQFFRDQLGAI